MKPTVILTGISSRGQVGEVVADAFAAQGASVVLVSRRPEHAEEHASALVAAGHDARGYGCDLTDPDSVAQLESAIRTERPGPLRALVHMAGGFSPSGPVGDSELETWNRMMAINLTTAYVTARAFLPRLRESRGSIVFFASEAALPRSDVATISAYAAAKAGVVTLMRAIAAEESSNGVRANAVAPSAIRTATNVEAMGAGARYVEREQVAAAVEFLCSDAASAITGEVIPLVGGAL